MIVLDASALVELLLASRAGRLIADRIADPTIGLHMPHLADVEVAQTLRRYTLDRVLTADEALHGLETLRALDVHRHAHEPLLDRIWALRHNMTAYDAAYVALAEALDGALLTCDARLARAAGSARVDLMS